jgi:hypothetical protein
MLPHNCLPGLAKRARLFAFVYGELRLLHKDDLRTVGLPLSVQMHPIARNGSFCASAWGKIFAYAPRRQTHVARDV